MGINMDRGKSLEYSDKSSVMKFIGDMAVRNEVIFISFMKEHIQDEGMPEYEAIHKEIDDINKALDVMENENNSTGKLPSSEALLALDSRIDVISQRAKRYHTNTVEKTPRVN